jgi:hypothetical protein
VSTILDALRKAQAEGDEKPDVPTPDFPPSFAEDPPLPPDDADGADGGGFEKEAPPRSYRMIAVVVLGVSLGLLLGRLLLPLATAPPDSSGMLADGVAEKHEDLLVAKQNADAERSPAELRSEKREEARAKKRRKHGRETADSRPDESADRIGGADVAAKPAVMPDAPASPKGAVEAGAVGDAADSEGSRPAASDGDGDRVAAARQPASSSGVPVPPTLPRPESPPLPGMESGGSSGAVASVEPVGTDGGGPRVLGNVVSPPATPPVADMEVPPGLDSLGRDPLATTAAATPPSEPPTAVLEPVTTPPPPAANAPEPRSLPNAPDDAPKIWLLFIQWSSTPEKRVVSLRQEGGSISVLREGDIVQGMRLAAIRRSGVEFQWRGQSFLVPVSRY